MHYIYGAIRRQFFDWYTFRANYYQSQGYRYGFNGKEKDAAGEWSSSSHYDYGFRIYNPAIARFLSVDPITASYPWYTPYQFAGNGPIMNIDLEGLEPAPKITGQEFEGESVRSEYPIPKGYLGVPGPSQVFYFHSGLGTPLGGVAKKGWYSESAYQGIVEKIGYLIGRRIGTRQRLGFVSAGEFNEAIPGCQCEINPFEEFLGDAPFDPAWAKNFGGSLNSGYSQGFRTGINSGHIDPSYIEFDIISLMQGSRFLFFSKKSTVNLGRQNVDDFITPHAYNRHKFDPLKISTSSKTQYGPGIDVGYIRWQTIKNADQIVPHYDSKGVRYATTYKKTFTKNISTGATRTRESRVIINHLDASKSTQFPYYKKGVTDGF